MNHDSIQDHVKVYKNVFLALLVLTVLTVLASYIHFSIVWVGVFVGLLIAVVKGYLVAANFMHLNDESPTIYWTLLLTVVFLVLLFFIPMLWEGNLVASKDTVLFDDMGQKHTQDRNHH